MAIFVDNSGADLLFGVIPFARELARHGSKVSLNFMVNCEAKVLKVKGIGSRRLGV